LRVRVSTASGSERGTFNKPRSLPLAVLTRAGASISLASILLVLISVL